MLTDLVARGVQTLSGTANPDEWLISWVNQGEPSAAGEYVNEENAMRCPALKAAVSVLAETLLTLDIKIFRETKSDRHEPAPDHPVQDLLGRQPSPEIEAGIWKETQQIDLGRYGNCYSIIQRTIRGNPCALWQRPPRPERTKLYRDEKTLKLMYAIRDERGRAEDPIPARDMFHIPYFSLDGLVGKSPVRMIREAIAGNRAAERYANEMFKNGGSPEMIFRHKGRLSEPAYARLQKGYEEWSNHGNRHKPILLEEDTEADPVSFDPDKTQMIAAREFLLREIARAYRITPHLLQDLEHATFSNVTELGRQFIIFTMLPWLRRWKGEIDRKLLLPPYFCRFDMHAFLEGNPQMQSNVDRTLFAIGAKSINEVRQGHRMNPLADPNADEHFVPLNMTPLSKATDPEWVFRKGAGGTAAAPNAPSNSDGKPPVGKMGARVQGPGAGDDALSPLLPGEGQGVRASAPSALTAAAAALAEVLTRMERIEARAALRAARPPRTTWRSSTASTPATASASARRSAPAGRRHVRRTRRVR